MSAFFSSLSPIDDAVVWRGEASSPDEIAQCFSRAAQAAVRWRSTPLDKRIEVARRYATCLTRQREKTADLIVREVGKLPWDAAGEVSAAIAKVELSIGALQERRDHQTFQEGQLRRSIRYRPIGVALVLGPFNFPLHLPGGQIIPALLAGNAVVFKPSDQATAVGEWIRDAWQQAGLPEDVCQLIVGGVDTAVAAIDCDQVGGVFLTGSRAAGRAIHRQLAGRPDVLLALELGGNNPIVVTDSVPNESAADVVTFSAFISAGQRCSCARRVIFVEGGQTAGQIESLIVRTQSLRVGLPGDQPTPQVGPLISTAAADNLIRTYESLVGLGCRPLIPLSIDPRRGNLVRPGIVDATTLPGQQLEKLGELEWFGPLLVVQRVNGFDEAIRLSAATPYGLAASLLGGSREMFERFVDGVGAGVVNWNRPTTGAVGSLPFGGLGDSGNHRPAGYFAIDFCNDPVASLEEGRLPDSDPWSIAQ